jgi:hypothetical protein
MQTLKVKADKQAVTGWLPELRDQLGTIDPALCAMTDDAAVYTGRYVAVTRANGARNKADVIDLLKALHSQVADGVVPIEDLPREVAAIQSLLAFDTNKQFVQVARLCAVRAQRSVGAVADELHAGLREYAEAWADEVRKLRKAMPRCNTGADAMAAGKAAAAAWSDYLVIETKWDAALEVLATLRRYGLLDQVDLTEERDAVYVTSRGRAAISEPLVQAAYWCDQPTAVAAHIAALSRGQAELPPLLYAADIGATLDLFTADEAMAQLAPIVEDAMERATQPDLGGDAA